jgi:hypothetical protein
VCLVIDIQDAFEPFRLQIDAELTPDSASILSHQEAIQTLATLYASIASLEYKYSI